MTFKQKRRWPLATTGQAWWGPGYPTTPLTDEDPKLNAEHIPLSEHQFGSGAPTDVAGHVDVGGE